jgi:hypothetical protein
MQQIPSWEANGCSPSEEITCFFLEPTGLLPYSLVQTGIAQYNCGLAFWGSIPGRGKRFFSLAQCPDQST